jgi:hypothetical protein
MPNLCLEEKVARQKEDWKMVRQNKSWDQPRIFIKACIECSLILNLQTVSPQYHCVYDDLFESTTGTQSRSIPTSQWQYKAGFTMDKPKCEDQDTQDDEQE